MLLGAYVAINFSFSCRIEARFDLVIYLFPSNPYTLQEVHITILGSSVGLTAPRKALSLLKVSLEIGLQYASS